MRCPLCGHTFDAEAMSCHTSCAFNKHCAIICCPNCGYQMTDESRSRLARAMKRLFRQQDEPETDGDAVPRPLSTLRPGQIGTVVSLEAATDGRQERLSVFGLMPGARVMLQQRRPACVVRVGYTELSLEAAVAQDILVQVDAD